MKKGNCSNRRASYSILILSIFVFWNSALLHSKWLHEDSQTRVEKERGSATQSSSLKFEGEYGLWVQNTNDEITVHWITAKPDSGILSVLNDQKEIYRFATPDSLVHKVSFNKPKTASIKIRYGSLKNELATHETLIHLQQKRPEAVFSKVDSVFVLGDIHGQFDNLTKLLINAKLIDSDLNWIGHKKHLVALGDIFDRGPDVTRTLWFFYQLERQAEKTEGKVHILLGNHEIMTFADDLRYLSTKEKRLAELYGSQYSKMYDMRDSILGKWLATKPGMLRIDSILFAHGGVIPYYANYPIQEFNNTLFNFLHEDIFTQLLTDSTVFSRYDSAFVIKRFLFFYGEDSVFWYRDYIQTDTLENELKWVLKKSKSKLHVVGHTPVKSIREYYDGKLIAVDLIYEVTEMLLLVRYKKNKYKRFKFKINGLIEQIK